MAFFLKYDGKNTKYMIVNIKKTKKGTNKFVPFIFKKTCCFTINHLLIPPNNFFRLSLN